MTDAVQSVRAKLREMLNDLPSEPVLSTKHLREVRSRAFAVASDLVEGAGVSQAEGLALLREHAVEVDSLLRERWPSVFASAQGSLSSEDRVPR